MLVVKSVYLGRAYVFSNLVHPCRVKSFRKAVSAVMDDLVKVLANKYSDNLHLINNNLTSNRNIVTIT